MDEDEQVETLALKAVDELLDGGVEFYNVVELVADELPNLSDFEMDRLASHVHDATESILRGMRDRVKS